MKKSFLILSVCFTIISSVNAQVSFGGKAGGAITSMPGDFSNFPKAGYYGGITAEIPLHKKVSLAAELVYSMQGNRQRIMFAEFYPFEPDNNADYEEKVKTQLSYINVPLLVKYQFTKSFFAETGLQPGLMVSARVKASRGSASIKSNYRSFDLSWPIGIGFRLDENFGVNFRYNAGLTTAYKGNFFKPRNSVFQAGLFYVWKKK